MVQLEVGNKQVLKILAGSTMIQVFAKIGTILGTACLATVVSIYMIEATIRQDGNCKKILKKRKEKDGKELQIQI